MHGVINLAKVDKNVDDFCPNKSTLLVGLVTETIDCDDKLIMKLFSREWPRELIEDEMRINNLIADKGLRAPKIKEIREYEGRLGLVYDKIPGVTFLERLLQYPDSAQVLSIDFAHIHHKITRHKVPELMPLRDSLRSAIGESPEVPREMRGKILEILDSLPDGDGLCHGDYHPENVILASDGIAVIDWIRACKGCFLADVAKSSLLLETWLPLRIKAMGKGMDPEVIKEFNEVYVSECLRLCGKSMEDLYAWRAPIAASRLANEVPGERGKLLEIIRDSI